MRTLRQLGFSLDDIRSMLSSSDSPHALFTAQLAALNAQAVKPVDDPAVRELSLKWDQLAAEFHGDDPAIKAAAAAGWEDNKATISAQVDWPADDGLVDYVNRARASR